MKETRFKDTEIGIIPEDWEVVKLEDKGSLLRGSLNPQMFPQKHFVEYSMPSFDNGCIPEVKEGITMQSGRTCIKSPVLLYNKLNVRQRRIWYIETCPDDSICSMEFLPYVSDKIDLCCLKYFVNTNKVKADFVGMSKGTSNSQKRIAPSDFLEYKIGLPKHKEEQSSIASALTSIDNLISSLDKLIEKKKNIKQGTMQQLLTGKKRLKGFTDSWVEKQLGRIGCTFSGLTGKTKEDFGTGNAKYITFLNVLNNPILKAELFEDVVVREGERQNSCHKGDLFFNTSSETPEEVGICAMLDTEQEYLYLNSFCFGYRLSDENVVPEYLAYYFRSNEGRKLMTVLAQGVTRYNMSKSAFNNAKIKMPTSFMEQKAIAEVLKSMDKEIEAIEIKKAKYESLKQGMMQQLLTGKIRLI